MEVFFMNEFIMNVGKFLTNHRRAIFTGGSILSLGVTVATAIAETKKAEVAVKEMREKKEKPEAKDYVKVYAKSYWKTAALFVFTIVVVSCNCYLDTKEITGLASACVISEKKLVNFKKSANEIVGKEQTKEISRLPHAICFDSLYFRSDEIYLEACMSDAKKPCYMIRFGHTPKDMSV